MSNMHHSKLDRSEDDDYFPSYTAFPFHIGITNCFVLPLKWAELNVSFSTSKKRRRQIAGRGRHHPGVTDAVIPKWRKLLMHMAIRIHFRKIMQGTVKHGWQTKRISISLDQFLLFFGEHQKPPVRVLYVQMQYISISFERKTRKFLNGRVRLFGRASKIYIAEFRNFDRRSNS